MMMQGKERVSADQCGPGAEALPEFLLQGPDHQRGFHLASERLPSGPLHSLAARSAQFFDRNGRDVFLAGALPADPAEADFLSRAAPCLLPGPWRASPVLPQVRAITPEPSAADYRAAVAEALRRIRAGDFEKIVLSRSLKLSLSAPAAPEALLAALGSDPLATLFSVPLSAAPGGRRLIGATPELLLEKSGASVVSHPLAGSARREAEASADLAAGEALLRSAKDLREHRIAAEMVLDSLAPWCSALSAPEGVALRRTARLWHLGTRIEGRLKSPDTPCAELLAVLHPTPAVAGLPRAAALAALPELEASARGFYAGAVGWLEGNGDGCWYLALRCAELAGAEARLYAGAGIVEGSDPQMEAIETLTKFQAMLAAFAVDPARLAGLS